MLLRFFCCPRIFHGSPHLLFGARQQVGSAGLLAHDDVRIAVGRFGVGPPVGAHYSAPALD
jgi:hypothetical protein